jgi:hypothetical protein
MNDSPTLPAQTSEPAVKPRLAPKNRQTPTTEGEIMLNSICHRLTFANVLSVIALFVALGGTAVAASLAANSVGTKQLKDQAVTTSKIKDGAVTGAKVNVSTLGTVPSANTANTANAAAPGAVRGTALGPIMTVSNASGLVFSYTAGSTFIQCPTGTTLISGGGTSGFSNVFATLSRKSDPNGWRYDAYNANPYPVTITVFANCLS